MPEDSAEMLRMQQDAIRRVRLMQARAQRSMAAPPPAPPEPPPEPEPPRQPNDWAATPNGRCCWCCCWCSPKKKPISR